ncbi:hypothetical protein B0H65DRAFT_576387 [Neurospora tetraspora]|uniref:Uncharacterized protein n=1 Tax=Neurospora tetraspora TaxID=94610 RepID=A0AAE0JDG5_9PEZI|nr:hypothetical protein B0H65DRAFT_576387 [Neurospora tetraspora]
MPWRAEFTTMVALWRPLLSYGVSVSSEVVVAVDGIRNDRIKMSRCRGDMLREPRLMLVFWDVKQGKSPRQLRSLLLDEEVGDASAATQAIRYQDIHDVSTFRYTADTQTVSFWLRKDVVDAMLDGLGEWTAYIWRTDSWENIGDGLPIATRLEMGESSASTARINQDGAGPFTWMARAGLTFL